MPVSAARFLPGVITSDLFLLAALGLGSVSNEPAPGMRLDVCVVHSSTSRGCALETSDKGNHQLGKELTAAEGGRQDTAEGCADVWQPEYDHFNPRS